MVGYLINYLESLKAFMEFKGKYFDNDRQVQ